MGDCSLRPNLAKNWSVELFFECNHLFQLDLPHLPFNLNGLKRERKTGKHHAHLQQKIFYKENIRAKSFGGTGSDKCIVGLSIRLSDTAKYIPTSTAIPLL